MGVLRPGGLLSFIPAYDIELPLSIRLVDLGSLCGFDSRRGPAKSYICCARLKRTASGAILASLGHQPSRVALLQIVGRRAHLTGWGLGRRLGMKPDTRGSLSSAKHANQ